MNKLLRIGALAAAVLTATGVCAGAAAADARGGHGGHGGHGGRGIGQVVFVQTDATSGNQVIAYRRADDGRLTRLASYDTGGRGGILGGSVVDHLASQGSLTHDAKHKLLYAVNAGSNTVSVFAVQGDTLRLRQIVSSHGEFPVSVAVHGDAVYVLNALGGGSIQGFRVDGGYLRSQRAWHRHLGLNRGATPQFTNTPGQVGFADKGRDLVVTTKANGNNVDVFPLRADGTPARTPVVTHLPDAVPFSFVTDPHTGTLYLTEAGPNAVVSFTVHDNGTLTQLRTASTGGTATCWITEAGGVLYASNAGSSTVTVLRTGPDGTMRTIGTTPTDPGTVDSAATSDGRFLYVQTGADGTLDEFAIRPFGTLTRIGSQAVPNGVGGEGIVAG